MSQDRIQAQLKGLGHASPLFRRQAAFGVFALLQAQPGLQKDAAHDIILACITDRHTVCAQSCSRSVVSAWPAAAVSCSRALMFLDSTAAPCFNHG
jgi:hypothetical protein